MPDIGSRRCCSRARRPARSLPPPAASPRTAVRGRTCGDVVGEERRSVDGQRPVELDAHHPLGALQRAQGRVPPLLLRLLPEQIAGPLGERGIGGPTVPEQQGGDQRGSSIILCASQTRESARAMPLTSEAWPVVARRDQRADAVSSASRFSRSTPPSGAPRHKMSGKRSPFGVKRSATELMQ